MRNLCFYLSPSRLHGQKIKPQSFLVSDEKIKTRIIITISHHLSKKQRFLSTTLYEILPQCTQLYGCNKLGATGSALTYPSLSLLILSPSFSFYSFHGPLSFSFYSLHDPLSLPYKRPSRRRRKVGTLVNVHYTRRVSIYSYPVQI